MSDELPEKPSRTWTPVPDPTVLTTEALLRAVAGERDYVDGKMAILQERLRGMDRATELLYEGLRGFAPDVEKAVKHQAEMTDAGFHALNTRLDERDHRFGAETGNIVSLLDERLRTVELQFRERDTRSEREARDNKIAVDAAFAANKVAVDAAFAAQKEAAAKQNEANQKAIDRSETSTAETINKLSDLRQATTDSLSQQLADQKERATIDIADLKERISRNEIQISSMAAIKQGGQETRTGIYALVGLMATVIAVVLGLIASGAFK